MVQPKVSLDPEIKPSRVPLWLAMRDIGQKQLPARRFNALFAGNRLPENNIPLECISAADSDMLEYSEEDVQEGIEYWKFSLIGTLIFKKPVYRALEYYAHTYWKVVPPISMMYRGICLFRFATEEDILKVLHGGLWTVNGKFLLLLR